MKTLIEWTEVSHSAKNIDVDGVILCLMTYDYFNSSLNTLAEPENLLYYVRHLTTDINTLIKNEVDEEEDDDEEDEWLDEADVEDDDDEFEDDFDDEDFDDEDFDDFDDDDEDLDDDFVDDDEEEL